MIRVIKSFIKVFLGVFGGVVLFFVIGTYFAHQYSSNIPKLTPREEVMTVSCGEWYKTTELVDVECVGEYVLYMMIVETDIGTAMVDERSVDELYVGDTKGYIRVAIQGSGLKSESGDPVEITMIVE